MSGLCVVGVCFVHIRERRTHCPSGHTRSNTGHEWFGDACFILHSTACKAEFDDLRDCPFSLALDGGIHLADFHRHLEGHPVMLGIDPSGWLVPAELADTRARVPATHENEGSK